MNLTLIAVLALIGAALCWCALAAPELPMALRAVERWARGAFRLEAVRVDLAQAELHRVSPGVWVALRWGVAAAAGLLGYALFGIVVIGLVVALAVYHLLGIGLESRRRQVEAERQRALLDAIRFGSSVIARAGSGFQMLEALASGGPFKA